FGPEVAVAAHAPIAGLAPGRYLRVTVHLSRSSGGGTPKVFDVTVARSGGQAGALSYSWRLVERHGPPIFLSSATAARPSFVVPDDGSYTFELTVTDAAGSTGT